MAANKLPIFGLTIKHGTIAGASKSGVKFVNADGVSAKTIYTAGENGAIIENVNAHSDDTSTIVVQLAVSDGVTSFPLGEITVAIAAGSNGGSAPSVNLFDAENLGCLRSDGTLMLAAGAILEMNPKSAVTAAKTLTLFPIGSDL